MGAVTGILDGDSSNIVKLIRDKYEVSEKGGFLCGYIRGFSLWLC